MSLIELFVIAVGLSMDAFAVAICKGLSLRKVSLKECTKVGLYFGGFQGGMPLIGFILGVQFKDYIVSIDHWIAFILLSFIGINMIRESREKDDEKGVVDLAEVAAGEENELGFKSMIMLSIATSIDALAVGVTFAFLQVDIIPAVSFIGIVTFILSMIGVKVGNIFGVKYKSKAEFAGGLILILMGIKILIEHLGFI
ncbi:manganese efflux pump MntP [Terrisporobacter sp.]|uniref:manganese efflux pump MntP n=1 Tax=Terrisporobacter sp. TaxID=1965305 RepID=UPI00262150D9|nr:manganese efflux pump MntP family protein [Terrisporobacter sp.]